MLNHRLVVGMALIALAQTLNAQSPALATPHKVVVKLVDKGGPMPYAFDPAVVNVQPGDTVVFTEAANVLHNVHFMKEPPGAKLGAATVSPWLMKLGDTYTIVLDKRFTAGTYEYVCEPHQMIGMHGTMILAKREAHMSGQ